MKARRAFSTLLHGRSAAVIDDVIWTKLRPRWNGQEGCPNSERGSRILGRPPRADARLRGGVHSTRAAPDRYGVPEADRGASWLGAESGSSADAVMVRVVPSVIASAPRRVFGSATSVKIGRPIVHQPPPPLEQVRPRVGGLDRVPHHVRERRLDDLAGMVRLLRRPIPEARPKPVRPPQ